MDDPIAAIAKRIEHDLLLASRAPTLRVVSDGPSAVVKAADAAMRSRMPGVPGLCATEIVVAYDGEERLRLVFLAEPSPEQQAEDLLDQLQTLVAEDTGERWPWCRLHDRWSEPAYDGEAVRWVCPGGHALARLGDLR